MKNIFGLLVIILMSFFIVGCSTQDSFIIKTSLTEDEIIAEEGELSGGDSDYTLDGADGFSILDGVDGLDGLTATFTDTSGGRSTTYTSDGIDSGILPQAGQMTASVWNDLKNYDFYLSLFENNQDELDGIFDQFFESGVFDTLNMVDVTVQYGTENLKGVVVELVNGTEEVIYRAITNANGQAFLFPKSNQLASIENIVINYESETIIQSYSYSEDNDSISIEFINNVEQEDVIEIMFVIDTTGSMTDEMSYLKSEIDYVISQVNISNPTSEIRLALLFYRDQHDDYLTKYFDFTIDIEQQKINLSAQFAGGGGDFEEAVEVALNEAVNKNWSEGNTTKLIFHVLDAPPHDTQEIMDIYFNAIYSASEKGIRIIPVASSGIDKHTEYLLRNEAMMTGGTYIFITGHSGIGGEHIDATVGETEVEYLNDVMIRLINEYHTGVEGEIIPYSSGNQE